MTSARETGLENEPPPAFPSPGKIRPRRFPVAHFAGGFLAAAGALLAATLGLSACNSDHTFAFVYAPSASLSSGLVNAYGARSQQGNLYLLEDSPVPSGGRNPTAIAANPDHHAIYVSNHDDSTVVAITIGTDGKIYPQNTYNITTTAVSGTFPTALAVSADGKFLYVTYTYQRGFTTASPGPGGISVFPIVNDYTLGTPVDLPIGRAPMAVATSSTAGFVYVVSQDSSAVASGAPQSSNLFAFSADAASGALTPLAGQTINSGNTASFGFPSGQTPASVIEDAGGLHLYVTDNAGNTVLTYSVAAGVPTQIPSATVATGTGPRGMGIDPTGKFLFVANFEGTISEYILNAGLPALSTTAPTSATGEGTTCVTVEPSQGNFVYASNSLRNTITGYQLNPADGTLRPVINSPYEATTLPLCLVAVPQTF